MTKKNSDCFECRELDKEEHIALKALGKGEATDYQQRLALKIIVNDFSRTHDLCYIPGTFDETSFLNGRAFVGQKILKYLNIPVGKLKDEEEVDG
jgi:hypothetical protein